MECYYQEIDSGFVTFGGNAKGGKITGKGQTGKKTVPGPQYVLLPLLTSDSQGSNSSDDEVDDDAGKKRRERAQKNEFKSMFGQDKEANGNMMFNPVSAAGSTYVNLSGSIPVNATTLPSADLSNNLFQVKGNLMKSIQTFLEKFNRISFGEMPKIINEELAEYINSLSLNHPTFYNDDEEHSVQYKEYLENSSKATAATNFNQEKEEPPQNSDIRQFIREECGIKNFRVKKSSTSLNNTSQISLVNAITPVLPTEEPEYSLSMGYERLSTTPKTESDEVIKSNVKNLVQIPSEYEVTSDNENE
nr:hypothetical protein [Tanacetum cinerariifolium]